MSSNNDKKRVNNLVAKHSRQCRGGAHKDKKRASKLIRGHKKSPYMGLYSFLVGAIRSARKSRNI